jgi:hypothetical protein
MIFHVQCSDPRDALIQIRYRQNFFVSLGDSADWIARNLEGHEFLASMHRPSEALVSSVMHAQIEMPDGVIKKKLKFQMRNARQPLLECPLFAVP